MAHDRPDLRLVRQTGWVFRRKPNGSPTPQPEWRGRFDRSRQLIESQTPPSWILERLAALDRMLVDAEADHDRLGRALGQLDLDHATAELKHALRTQGPAATPQEQQLIDTLRARYEMIHDLINKRTSIRRSIDAALVDVDLLAARSVELGARAERWQLDDTVERLRIDVAALEQAHADLADL